LLLLITNSYCAFAFPVLFHKILGVRGFFTKDMVAKKGRKIKDFYIPRISKMIRVVDADTKTTFKKEVSMLR